MTNQIKRARMFFDEAEKGVTELSAASRWPVNNQKLPSILKSMLYRSSTRFFSFAKKTNTETEKNLIAVEMAV